MTSPWTLALLRHLSIQESSLPMRVANPARHQRRQQRQHNNQQRLHVNEFSGTDVFVQIRKLALLKSKPSKSFAKFSERQRTFILEFTWSKIISFMLSSELFLGIINTRSTNIPLSLSLLFISLNFCLLICLFLSLFLCLFVYLFLCFFAYLFVCLLVCCLSIYLFLCWFVCLLVVCCWLVQNHRIRLHLPRACHWGCA